VNCSGDDLNEVHLGVSLKDHTEVCDPNMVSVNDNNSPSGSSDLPLSIRTTHLCKLLIKCLWRQGLTRGLPVRDDISPAVFKQR
jgi:hypothetical protein